MKTMKKRRVRKNRSRGIYLLPNLFTSASLFGGFYALIASMQDRFEAAALAILISCVFDGLDGRIARFTGTTSQFGTEYDSLSDLVAFGVAPGILAFQWALKPFGRLGWLAAFVYVICGALRLARFNVQTTGSQAKYFKGLPIPAAAAFISTMILFTNHILGQADIQSNLILATIYILSFLMVSTLDYPTFKEVDIRNQKPFHVLVSVILILIVVAYKPRIMLFLIIAFYVLSGPAATLCRRHLKKRQDHSSVQEAFPASLTENANNGLDQVEEA